MRVSATSLCLLAGQAVAAPPAARQDGAAGPVVQDGVFQFPFFTIAHKEELLKGGNGATGTATTKRQVPAGLDNVNYGGVWPAMVLGMTIELGTPPQKVLVEPDTGSYQLWVPGATPTDGGTDVESVYFDRNASTSKQDLKMESGCAYGTRERVQLNMFSDEVSLGGKSLGQLAFGIGNMTSPHTTLGRTIGVMGLLPAPPHSKDSTDFVPQMLLDKKITKTRAFGMALRENGQGLLTFGGYDTSKFSGPLEKLPILPNKWRHSIVSIQSVSFKASSCGSSEVVLNKETASRDLTMCIDSGSPALVLKKDLFEIVEAKLQAKPSSGPLKVACDVVDAGASLDFRLTNSTRVSVPLSDMLLQKVDSGKNCILAIQKSRVPSDLFIGGHFFRRSFVLHDPDGDSIYVGRGADCGSSVVAIDGKMPTDVIKGKCSEEPAAAEKPSASAMDSIAGLTVEELTALIDPRIHKDEA